MSDRSIITTGRKAASESFDPLWGYDETAAFLRIPKATLYYQVSQGTAPPSYRVGKYRRWKPADVLAWLEQHAA